MENTNNKELIRDKGDLVDFLESRIMSLSQLKREIEGNSEYDLHIEDLENIVNRKVIPILKCDEVKCVRDGDIRLEVRHNSSDPMVEVKKISDK